MSSIYLAVVPALMAISSPGNQMSFTVAGGLGQCFSYAKLALLPVGPFVCVGATQVSASQCVLCSVRQRLLCAFIRRRRWCFDVLVLRCLFLPVPAFHLQDPYMVSAPWVNLTAAQGKQGVNCSGITKDPCTCSWYADGLDAGSPVFEFAGAPGECYSLAQVNQRTLEMLNPTTPGSGLRITLDGGTVRGVQCPVHRSVQCGGSSR